MHSDVIKKGIPAAPNRSLLYALGYTKEELERPLIGVVCSYNEIVPGHMNLDKIAEQSRPASGPPAARRWSSPPSPCATASPWAMWA
mgnify:CR=1 FL=1